MANADAERDELEVLASDFMERLRRGESPAIDDYAAAHPELAGDIRDLFPTIAAAEEGKTKRLRLDRSVGNKSATGSGLEQSGGTAHVTVPPRAGTTAALLASSGFTPEPLIPREGMQIGKYTLAECIGQGSLGTVWRSRHPDLGVAVAVKVLRPGLLGKNVEQTGRFLREAHAAALINHPHVVRVFDAGEDQGLRYLVMEYVKGGSVGELLRNAGGRLPVPRTLEIARAVAGALEAAAAVGIIHRDIKPDNILLDEKGSPKLADLGLAKQLAGADEASFTATGVGLGTPLYIAPEQAMADTAVDVRADIYSLGVTLYHMVTGAPPFSGVTAYQIVHHHLHKPLPDPRKRNPEVPVAFAQVLCRMLAKKPEDRYQTAAELSADLARVEAGEAPLSRRTSRGWWVAAAFAAVVLTAAATVLAVRQWRPALQKPLSTAAPPPSPALGTQPASPAKPPLPMNTTAVAKTTADAERLPVPAAPPVSRSDMADSPPPRSEPAKGQPASPPLANGTIRPGDWQVLGGPPGSADRPPRPLLKSEYTLENGVFRVAGVPGRGPSTLIYSPAQLRKGPFAISLEARNVAFCGIAEPGDEADTCQISLAKPATGSADEGKWHTIEIRRRQGEITCTMDNHPVRAIEGSHLARGQFWITVYPGIPCELRKFTVAVTDSPRQPPPPGSQPPPPRPD